MTETEIIAPATNGQPPAITPEMIAADQHRRRTECAQELASVLRRHRCTLVATPSLAPDGRIVAEVQLQAY